LKILDPACGSGAFLNQAVNFLVKEHQFIDDIIAELTNTPLRLFDTDIAILENNIYGVDINEESIEIAKLSLWLRTAKQGRKLSNLSDNIKCGNSLIDDPAVAGNKAFNWQKEFPDIFDKGGFDVIIGNPPYLRVQGLKEHYFDLTKFYEKKYVSATGNYDIYVLFMEKSFNLISEKGIVSFIIPHKFLVTDFGAGIRKFFKEETAVEKIVHFGSELVFEDASTYTCIINLTKTAKDKILFKKINTKNLFNIKFWDNTHYKNISTTNWDLQNENVSSLIEKLEKQPYKIEDVFENIFVGMQTSLDSVYVFEGKDKGNFIEAYNSQYDFNFEIEKELLKPFIKGNEISRYKNLNNKHYVLFPYNVDGSAVSEDYIQSMLPKTYSYLKKFETVIRGRENGKMNIENGWYLYIYQKNHKKFPHPKIMTQEISLGCNMTYDENGIFYHPSTIYSFVKNPKFKVDEKYYLGILNSKVMWFFLKNTGTELGGGYFRFKTNYLKPFPLPEISTNSQLVIDAVNCQLKHNKELQEITQKFHKSLLRRFKIKEISKILQDWYLISYSEFLKELGKKKIKLSLSEEAEWETYFITEAKKAFDLKEEIEKTDNEINEMVYKLYELNEEEIKIVEEG
jgi:type II restriction/modification system DNA methylase subunit YeeA